MRFSLSILRLAVDSTSSNPMRTFLTGLGVAIGVATIISISAIVNGVGIFIVDQFKGFGTNTVTVTSFTSREMALKGERSRLSNEDLARILQQVPYIRGSTPVLVIPPSTNPVRFRDREAMTTIFATTPEFQDVYQSYARVGRFLHHEDGARASRVAIVGHKVRSKLGLSDAVLGKYLTIGGDAYRIVGFAEEKGDLFGTDQDDFIVIPYETGRLLSEANEEDIIIHLAVEDSSLIQDVVKSVEKVLREDRQPVDGEYGFRVRTAKQLVESLSSITRVASATMVGIVGITLVVAGIGIMNIMLVSITERTREIGLLKALGARRKDILGQFVAEALLTCSGGCLVGLVVGFLIAALGATIVPGSPPVVPSWAVTFSIAFSLFIGLFFGVIPAAKAANLDPIEALQHQ